jgi:hypothetical protein
MFHEDRRLHPLRSKRKQKELQIPQITEFTDQLEGKINVGRSLK